jgi:hypothetical protein
MQNYARAPATTTAIATEGSLKTPIHPMKLTPDTPTRHIHSTNNDVLGEKRCTHSCSSAVQHLQNPTYVCRSMTSATEARPICATAGEFFGQYNAI